MFVAGLVKGNLRFLKNTKLAEFPVSIIMIEWKKEFFK